MGDPLDDGGCAARSREVSLFVDGELGDSDRLAYELHLRECALCHRAVGLQRRFKDAIRAKAGSNGPRAPEALRARLAIALDAEPAPLPPPQALPARPWASRWLRPLPVAAAGATALGLSAWLWVGLRHDGIVRDIVARHARTQPLELISSDPVVLEQWLADKVDFRVRVPRAQRPDLALIGARLSNVRDHSAVYVLYGTPESPSRRVSMLVFDDPSGDALPTLGNSRRVADRDVWLSNAQGYNVATWKQNEVSYSLVTEQDDDVVELVSATGP